MLLNTAIVRFAGLWNDLIVVLVVVVAAAHLDILVFFT